ncbi:hypothetical protein [Hymenobacter sp. PAMC 26628]|uniref:hypothetical protein n=1 Tax=Hymenobacter sp. PAMC 26628 TaxID=1484118 RepID=UPI00076FE97A|nr:hypothetical protein [Hymenobacter sp. PAMC 26628]AMJ66794.1 hypothetical protein AXW84_16210 [Hymenobacter sp. PAMC 26628]
MLRLDKTVTRKTTLHADHSVQEAEDAARWRAMPREQRQEVLAFLRQQARVLRAFRDLGREQDRGRNAGDSTTIESLI